MRLHSFLALSGLAATVACASSSARPATSTQPATTQAPAPATAADSGAAASGAAWQGEIRPESGSTVSGTVRLTSTAAGQTAAVITLAGATANGTHPWHLHSGTCAQKGPIVGPPAAYTPLTADATGAARLEATLPFAAPASGSYSVNIHMSPTQMGMIVGCADLRM